MRALAITKDEYDVMAVNERLEDLIKTEQLEIPS